LQTPFVVSHEPLQQSVLTVQAPPVCAPDGPPHSPSHVPQLLLQQSALEAQVAPSGWPDVPPHV
jgi:hypothetical protein